MSLVPDYSSSDSDSDNEPVQQQVKKRTLSSILPPPKKTKLIQVELPKLQDEDDEDNTPSKPLKSSVGLGLADLLPAPKNYKGPVPVTKTTTAFMPHALSRKGKEKQVAPVVQQKQEEPAETIAQEEEEVEEEVVYTPRKYTGSFFHIGKELKEEPVVENTPKPVQPTPGPVYTVERPPATEEPQYTAVDAYAYDPNAMYSTDPSTYYQYQQQYEANNVGELEDGEDLQRLVGKRLRGESNIQIKTIHQADMLPSDEWREHQALTAAPKFNNGTTMQASKLQMKKNNIMALAAHAVNNQEKLDEMFAAHKKTRREAATKYGF
ncbi:mitotic checkpoint regulator, MAD2B-interacting-domain-containing protein [Helicostylum pulchrum]|nr:mitotic checkpoint regulator, MAD2B-interacting-domain-containing protein [Helicostylum pulchrum]